MGNMLHRENEHCESFRDALEGLPVRGGVPLTVEDWRAELPEQSARHAEICEECRIALGEFAETRNALSAMPVRTAGPWFTARIMAAIAAKEREDEARDGVWIVVRRFAPRVAALSVLLLIVGGGWSLQQSSKEPARPAHRGGDMVFDSAVPQAPGYDDGFSVMGGIRP
ncbi:MAG TPA: hypothetical protein VL128_13395 [Candidatus Eisenbacteria bacterium]|nr:hypothetical protein [Candidatus Eisenbacteria bacterium]